MTNTNSPAEPTPSNPAAGTTAAAATGKPARKGPRRATAAAGAPVAKTSPAPALLVIDANGMIVPPPVVPASESPAPHAPDSPESPETFDAGITPSADAAAIDVVESDSAPAEPETVIAAETAEDAAGDTVVAEPIPAERKSEPAEAQTPLDAGTVRTGAVRAGTVRPAADGADAGTEDKTNTDKDADTDTALVVKEKIAAEGPDEAAPAEVVAAEPTGVEPNDEMATSTEAIEARVTDSGVPDSAVPDSEVPGSAVPDVDVPASEVPVRDTNVEATAQQAATLADPDSNADTQITEDVAEPAASESDAAESGPSESGTADTVPVKSDIVETAGSGPADTASAAAAVPISRRERRLAEQQAENGGEVIAALSVTENAGRGNSGPDDAVTDVTDADSDSNSEAAPESAQRARAGKSKPRTKRNRFVAAIRGLFFLLVISAVVVATGTVLSGPEVDVNHDSPTQRQRQAAWEATITLQASALTLANAATTPVVRKELSTTAAHLGIQAAALSNGLPSDGPTATTTAPALAPAASTIAELLQGLASNADSLLTNAQTAQSSMGRVFASVGTSQLLQAEQLGSAIGAAVSASAFLPAKVSFAVPTGPQCTSTLEPRPGVTVDSALTAAAAAEQKAVYAYQVATTRFAEPQFSKSTALLARHEEKLEVLNEELRLRCLPPAAPVAGFALDAAFTTLPKQALRTLESELGAIYADLSALSTESSTGVPPAAEATVGTSTATAADATQQPLNGSNLREISVLWLLDSIKTHTFWGGTIDALPGIGQEAATVPSSPTN